MFLSSLSFLLFPFPSLLFTSLFFVHFLYFPIPLLYPFPSQLEDLGSAKRHLMDFEVKMLMMTVTSEILMHIHDYNSHIKLLL